MTTKIYFSLVVLIAFPIIFLLPNGYAQDMGAVYWFKKAVNEKNTEKKIEYYLRAVQAKPEFIEAHYNLGLTYLIQKDHVRAEDAFKKALSADPASTNNALKSNILSRLGTMYRKLNRTAEAEEAFRGAFNISTDTKFKALTLYELGQTKMGQGQYDEAVNLFRQGLETSPEDRTSFETAIQIARNQKRIADLYQQGLQLIDNQQFSQAAEIFNKIIAIDPNQEEAKKQLEKMTALLQKKQEITGQQIQPLYEQAISYLAKGNWSEAVKHFERIKMMQPNYPEVDKLIAQAREQQYQQSLNAQKIENFYKQGIDNFDSGDYTVALINFEKAAELDSNYKDLLSRIETTKRELNRVHELVSKMPQRDQVTYSEVGDNFQLESNRSGSGLATDSRGKQLITEKSRQLNDTINSQLIQNYYQEALDLMQNQQWQRAVILLEKVKLISPDYKNTAFLLSQAKQNIEMSNIVARNEAPLNYNLSSNSKIFFIILASIVGLPLGLFLMSPTTRAKYYILRKKYEKAREIYERMLLKKPNNIKLYITLANIYINENRVDEVAIRVFERAIQYNTSLKLQLEPLVSRYNLQKAKSSDTPKNLLTGKLGDALKAMGN